MFINDGFSRFSSPEGQVFDYKEPHIAKIIEQDGTVTETVEHLYANHLVLGQFDDIKNYILVDDPRAKKVENNGE